MPAQKLPVSNPEREALECFVIMPYGVKTDTDGTTFNYDITYEYIIKAAIEELESSEHRLKINTTRCDKIQLAGSIDVEMFRAILEADIAIIDISTLNPNVFYELGVRHALRDCVTIVIRKDRKDPPFNIQGIRLIDYDINEIESFEHTKNKIKNFVVNGLRDKETDSPIREALPDLKIRYKPRTIRDRLEYQFIVAEHKNVTMGVVTGSLQDLRNYADIWVSSENTDMQLPRYHDRSVSATIRYLGAEKENGRIIKDSIADAVFEQVEKDAYGQVIPVKPGSITPTTSGDLKRTHGVKKIYHAATVQGTPGLGYRPVPNIAISIATALSLADTENNAADAAQKCDSILFPFFGTGVAEADIKSTTSLLIDAAVNHIENNGSTLRHVYWLAFDRTLLAASLDALDDLVRNGRLLEPPRDPESVEK